MIKILNLCKRFKNLIALDDISVTFEEGQVISLIGPNGSGKTTLIKSILGLIRPNEGQILFQNKSIYNDFQYRSQIGYMPQIGRYPDNMKMGQLFQMLQNIRNVHEEHLDTELINSFELRSMFEKPMRTLSGGTRQKVSAAIAFMFDSKVLILDEPTAGLDPVSSEILKDKVNKEKIKNKLIVITSHILSDLDDITTHVMYLQDGHIMFLKDINTLRESTGEAKLSKAIAQIMKSSLLT
ncbi:MAG: ATP-binding cassette domain-containing protein [Saprospiraceae bacterium]|nr:ATP-binding cassette domain-containing protein [Saprospiraceae bacterium]